jgi:hypothetical protein
MYVLVLVWMCGDVRVVVSWVRGHAPRAAAVCVKNTHQHQRSDRLGHGNGEIS